MRSGPSRASMQALNFGCRADQDGSAPRAWAAHTKHSRRVPKDPPSRSWPHLANSVPQKSPMADAGLWQQRHAEIHDTPDPCKLGSAGYIRCPDTAICALHTCRIHSQSARVLARGCSPECPASLHQDHAKRSSRLSGSPHGFVNHGIGNKLQPGLLAVIGWETPALFCADLILGSQTVGKLACRWLNFLYAIRKLFHIDRSLADIAEKRGLRKVHLCSFTLSNEKRRVKVFLCHVQSVSDKGI